MKPYKGLKSELLLTVVIFFLLPIKLPAEQWTNSKDTIGNPNVARLQQEKKELTDLERQEIEKYGYTGLELMTYVDINKDLGRDSDYAFQFVLANKFGHIQIEKGIEKTKYYYKDHKALLTYDGIKPGDVAYKKLGIVTHPPSKKGNGWLDVFYLISKEKLNKNDGYNWTNSIRRIRHYPMFTKSDRWFGACFTFDDYDYREPWQEIHKILGRDTIRGGKCFVIESRYQLDPNYYLGKRVTWVTEDYFLDIHEEQFNKEGKLFRIFDKHWEQIKPHNYWARTVWNAIDLETRDRTLFQQFDWNFDNGFGEKEFRLTNLEKEEIWRKPKNPPLIKTLEDFPPEPKVRWEFWERIGIKPELIK